MDASVESGRMGRPINNGVAYANSYSKVIKVRGRAALCIFANKDIKPGDETMYYYNRGVQTEYPW